MASDDLSNSSGVQVRETYTLGYSRRLFDLMGKREIKSCAPFLLSLLRPGMNVLDCGCGPGSITMSFTKYVSPGLVIGLDIDEKTIEFASMIIPPESAVRFIVGSAYELPFPEQTFDLVFCHALIVHLRDPLRVLLECKRVLRKNGIVVVIDPDYGSRIVSPTSEIMEAFHSLYLRVLEYNGANPFYSRGLRGLLAAAGFARSEATAVCASFGSQESVRTVADSWRETIRQPQFSSVVLGQEWATLANLDMMDAEIERWSNLRASFVAMMSCAAIGWVTGSESSSGSS